MSVSEIDNGGTDCQKEIPEVKEVVLVNEISPELLDFARKLLNHNHEAQECI